MAMPVNLKPIRAMTFDVGGTLIEPWPSVGHIYAQVAAEQGYEGLNPSELTQRFFKAWRAKSQFRYAKHEWFEMVSETFSGPLDVQVHFFEALYARFTEPRVWRVYDDVTTTLDALRQHGLKLAAVSNWDDRLRPLLKALGLDIYFDAIAISGEIGFQKPDPRIFHLVLNDLGCSPSESLHVGDSPTEDIDGAHAAGMQALLINRTPRPIAGFDTRALAPINATVATLIVDRVD